MLRSIKVGIRTVLGNLGYDIVRAVPSARGVAATGLPPDFDDATASRCQSVSEYTMTSPERIFALCRSVEYIVKHEIPGDIVECGVWRGGSMMAVARTLMESGASRNLYLFDTFEGMTAPTDADRDFRGDAASALLARGENGTNWTRALSSLDEVKKNLRVTGYDEHKVVFVPGRVEETIPARAPGQISLLRLDTDWYESTYHELVHLYPRLSVGGVLIIDDYGHWAGARKAVDQYIDENQLKILLNRIDYTGRIAVKLEG